MSYDNSVVPWIFVIDTTEYSGNFERQMVAYITGHVGDCSTGEEEAKIFWKDFEDRTDIWDGEDGIIFDLVVSLPDEHGCCRPATIWDTPGWFNDGMGGHYRDGQKEEAEIKFKEKCISESEDPGGLHPDDHQDHKENWLKRSIEPMVKCPAYQSVAVLWNEKPCPKAIEIMKSRAFEFCQYAKETEEGVLKFLDTTIYVTGFRLIYQRIVNEEVMM